MTRLLPPCLALALALALAANSAAAAAPLAPDPADGVFAIPAAALERHGSMRLAASGTAAPVGNTPAEHISHWTKPGDHLACRVRVPAAAEYRVLVETASLRDSALRVAFSSADGEKSIAKNIPKTGAYTKYRAGEIGDITLPAGEISIRILAENPAGQWRPLDLRRLTLYPVAGAPGSLRAATRPAPAGAGFSMPGYYLWAPSVLKVGDTYHMFVSRWPAETGMGGWLTHSECVRATSKNILGPYVFQQVAMRGRPGKFDPTVHENRVVKIGDKFVHYYCAHAAHGTGIAWSDSIEGPWTRSGEAVIPPPAVGPSVLVNPDNSVYVFTRKGGGADALKTGAGFRAKTFDSPHVPVAGGKNLLPDGHELEDPAIWRAGGVIHVVQNDWRARVTGVSKDGVRYYSTDNGESYRLAERFAFDKTVEHADGRREKMRRVEHAFIHTNEREEVTALFLSCLPQDGPSVIIAHPVQNYTPPER
ncbi:MAG: hypothetical protein LBM92_00605 [Opitutaceae bacterium]|jgi:hypothetical protein|nr:hypothetical protein [Opitutaceae bacterium]